MSCTPLDPRGGECVCTRPFLPLAFILLIFAASSLHAQWQHLPFGHSGVSSLTSDPSNLQLWGGASSAGLWHSVDGGATWQPASTLLHPLGRVNVYDLYDLDGSGDSLICRGSRSGTYWNSYSFDSGLTWQQLTDPLLQELGEFHVWQHGHHVWFFLSNDNDGLCRSLDYGLTWTLFPNDGSSWYNLYQDPLHDSTLFVNGFMLTEGDGLWRSDDLGETWQPMLFIEDLPDVLFGQIPGFCRLSDNTLLIASNYNQPDYELVMGLLASTDEGETWTLRATLPDGTWINHGSSTALREDISVPGRLYLEASDNIHPLWQSDDYGFTWLPVNGLPQGNMYATIEYQNPQSGALFVDVTGSGLYRSDDHADTWQLVPDPPIGTWFSELLMDDEAVIAQRIGSESHYLPWQLAEPFLEWLELNPLPAIGDTHYRVPVIWYKDGNTLVAHADGWVTTDSASVSINRVATSSDNGNTWTFGPLLSFNLDMGLFSTLNLGEFTRILAVERQRTLLMTDDLGNIWSFVGEWPGEWIYEIEQSESKICVFVLEGSFSQQRIYCSADSGANWESSPLLAGVTSMVLLGNDLFVALANNCIWWSDAGWEVRGPLPYSQGCQYPTCFEINGIPGDPPTLIGTLPDTNSVFISLDRGLTWEARELEMPFAEQNTRLDNLTYDPYRHRLWVSAGIGVCYLDANELSADGPLVFKPADYTLLSVYPNPFNSTAKVRFDLLKREKVSVQVYDVLGRHVQTLTDEMREAGRHELSLSLDNCSSGLYFVQLHSSSASIVEKIMLLK